MIHGLTAEQVKAIDIWGMENPDGVYVVFLQNPVDLPGGTYQIQPVAILLNRGYKPIGHCDHSDAVDLIMANPESCTQAMDYSIKSPFDEYGKREMEGQAFWFVAN